MKLAAITLLICLFSLDGAHSQSSWPVARKIKNFFVSIFQRRADICNYHPCPSFTVEIKKKGYELRCYNATKWVMTSGPISPYLIFSGSGELFMRLYHYIGGNNVEKTKMEMTVPVRMQYPFNGKKIGKGNMDMSFWIPSEFQNSPPQPKEKTVHIVSEKRRCFYVHSFGGFVLLKKKLMKELYVLMDVLDKDNLGKTYDKTHFIYSGYDKPTTFLHRHNEVWLEHIE